MSWYREVKTLLTLSLLLLAFIIWSFVIHMFGGVEINHKMFLITAVGCFIMQGIYNKSTRKNKKIISSIIPIVIFTPLYFINHSILAAVTYSLYTIVCILFINGIEENKVDYDDYKTMSLKSLRIFILISVITVALDEQFAAQLFRYYVFSLIITIMLLKESRNFKYKVRDKYSRYFNLSASGILLLMCFSGGEILVRKTLDVIIFACQKVVYAILFAVEYPFKKLFEAFCKLIKPDRASIIDDFVAAFMRAFRNATGRDIFTEVEQANNPGYWIAVKALRIVVIAGIILLIVKFILKLIRRSKRMREGVEEIREKIDTPKITKRDGKIKRLIKQLFIDNLSINMRIFEIFKEFQIRTEDKKIFKAYMTATQLKEVTKIYVDKSNELDEMAEIYNEAKFSDHEMKEEHYIKVKDNYNEIKKAL